MIHYAVQKLSLFFFCFFVTNVGGFYDLRVYTFKFIKLLPKSIMRFVTFCFWLDQINRYKNAVYLLLLLKCTLLSIKLFEFIIRDNSVFHNIDGLISHCYGGKSFVNNC